MGCLNPSGSKYLDGWLVGWFNSTKELIKRKFNAEEYELGVGVVEGIYL